MVNERTCVLYLLVSELVKGVYVLQSVGFELEECIADMIFFFNIHGLIKKRGSKGAFMV